MKIGGREKRLLVGLAGVLALGLAVRAANRRGDGAAPGPVTGNAATASATPATREVVALDLSALQPKPDQYRLGRDPFNFVPDPPPPPPPAPPPVPTPRPFVGPVLPPPPPKPQPPSPDHLRFLGSFGPPESRIAVVVSGDQIYNVHTGAVLEGKFIIQEIGYESVAIGFVGFPEEPPRRLPAGGSPS
ncbi:MAG TPA: hypothetical protein VGV61_16370 [Thermoanaerobaculia bacterium]|nr:hypothetical protein [Thermoanaerobaculia bacterium]